MSSEELENNRSVISDHIREVLSLLGEDTEREGIIKTPDRVAKAMQYLTKGYWQNPEEILRSAQFKENYRQMVIVKDIDFFSICEHHMLPFLVKHMLHIFLMVMSQGLVKLRALLMCLHADCKFRRDSQLR